MALRLYTGEYLIAPYLLHFGGNPRDALAVAVQRPSSDGHWLDAWRDRFGWPCHPSARTALTYR